MQEYNTDEIAVLLTTCNKYEPGYQTFRLQRLVGLKENSNDIIEVALNNSNIMNEDTSNLPIGSISTSAVLRLEVPVEVSRRFPVKFIPPGTRFIVTFSSGDITKPVITGGDFSGIMPNTSNNNSNTSTNSIGIL